MVRSLRLLCARPLMGGRAAPPPRGGLGRVFDWTPPPYGGAGDAVPTRGAAPFVGVGVIGEGRVRSGAGDQHHALRWDLGANGE